jgi:hypothetical protein
MRLRAIACFPVLMSFTTFLCAASRPAQLNDVAVPAYSLPDPLVADDGSRIDDAARWPRRRAELLEVFSREVYGRTPIGRPASMRFEITTIDRMALGGRAVRKEVTIWFGHERTDPRVNLLIYLPNDAGARVRRPAFLGLNFFGNHTVHADPGVALPTSWVPRHGRGVVNGRATEAGRGTDASMWQVERVLARGYAVVTAYAGDLCPDRPDGLKTGAAGWLRKNGQRRRGADDGWGAIGAWAWGLSRALDYLEADEDIDAAKVVVHGHSRLGKAALWAGAQDERFAMVISNNSGCGGAALSERLHGETVARINAVFPHWFAKAFRRYNHNEAALPVDQHELLALMAPRPLYVASAEEDDWADPRGEFLAVQAAEPVYRLFRRGSPELSEMPLVNEPAGEWLRYHIRAGKHDLTAFDWSCYLDFADQRLGR